MAVITAWKTPSTTDTGFAPGFERVEIERHRKQRPAADEREMSALGIARRPSSPAALPSRASGEILHEERARGRIGAERLHVEDPRPRGSDLRGGGRRFAGRSFHDHFGRPAGCRHPAEPHRARRTR